MAVADGRLRNRAGVCIVSRGPGLSNAMVSLHSAFAATPPRWSCWSARSSARSSAA